MKNFIDLAAQKMIAELAVKHKFTKKLKKLKPEASGTEEFKLKQQVEIINRTQNLGVTDAALFFRIVDKYFSMKRPRYFSEFEKVMSPRFAEAISLIPFKIITTKTNNYHQFAKTCRSQDYNDLRQKHISVKVLEPFLSCLKSIRKDDPIPELTYKIISDNVLILTRHATTIGMYAPGKQIFSVAKSLVRKGKNVHVVSYGDVDDTFVKLMKENSNFKVLKGIGDSDDASQFHWLRDKINKFKPAAIFTEIEVSILVSIEICKLLSPIFLISAGFYRVPW